MLKVTKEQLKSRGTKKINDKTCRKVTAKSSKKCYLKNLFKTQSKQKKTYKSAEADF